MKPKGKEMKPKGKGKQLMSARSDRDRRREKRKAERKAKKAGKDSYMRRFEKVNSGNKKAVEPTPTPTITPKPKVKSAQVAHNDMKRKLDVTPSGPSRRKTVLIDETEPVEPTPTPSPVSLPVPSPVVAPVVVAVSPAAAPVSTPVMATYVPPSLRGKVAASPQDVLRLKIRSHLNKMSLENLRHVVKDIAELSNGVSLHDFNEAFARGLIASVCDPIRLTSAFIFPYAGCVKVVAALVGDSVSAYLCAHLCETLTAFVAANDRTKAINAVLFFAHLHATHVMDATLIYSIIKHLCKSLHEELPTELLVVLVSVDGGVLRGESQTALRDIIEYAMGKMEGVVGGVAGGTVRGRILKDLLLEMRSAKGQKNFGVQERRMDDEAKEVTGKVMGQVMSKMKLQHPIVHRMTWGQCVGERKGMWWLDIAKGLVKEDDEEEDGEVVSEVGSEIDMEEEPEEEDEENEEQEEQEQDATKSLSQLTSSHRILNSPLRRAVFRCIATSDDSADCLHQISSLGLKPEQEKDVLTVILHCLTHEKAYNHFYYNVLKNLLNTHRRWKYAFMFCLWDKWAAVNDSSVNVSESVNLAICVGLLIKHGKVSVTALKGVEWGKGMESSLTLHMKVLLIVLCLVCGKSAVSEVFSGIAKNIDLETLRTTLQKWIHLHLLSDIPTRVAFTAQFLSLLLPPLTPDLDLPSPTPSKPEIVKLIGTRLQLLHGSLEQLIDYD